jgi:GDPmannose 4,6-dehydratase
MTTTSQITSKMEAALGWVPEITLDQMITEVVVGDLQAAKQKVLLRANGYAVAVSTK